MILVADSGSSKTDWLMQSREHGPEEFKSNGLNPYFLTEKEIVRVLQSQCADIVKKNSKISEIYFFGAGCSNPDRREIVSNALSQVFPKTFISVDSDLLGSAYATCGTAKGYCCVLGTGSNVSFFDGETIFDGKHGIGYVLGDEGSGSWFGRCLITDYLYNKMPIEISKLFQGRYKADKETVIKNVYQKNNANAYLASFSSFLSEVKDTPYAQEIITAGFTEFIDTNIKTYPDYHNQTFHFVGSVAFHFSSELKLLCGKNGITMGKIIEKPIHHLFEFIVNRNLQ